MNNNHDEKTGRFAPGSSAAAANGHHEAVSPSPTHRNVNGLSLHRAIVVTKHNGADSVGTASGGNGSSGSPGAVSPGGSFAVRVKPKQTTTGLGRAAAERVALNVATDRRHFPDEKADVQSRFKSRATGIR